MNVCSRLTSASAGKVFARLLPITASFLMAACGGGGSEGVAPLTRPAGLDPAELYALGVVTPDAWRSAAEYERVLGVQSCLTADSGVVLDKDGRSIAYRMLVPCFQNFYVKLQQPLNAIGPWASSLDRFGYGVMNLQMRVGDTEAVRTHLEAQGAAWVLSTEADAWAYIDLIDWLGFVFEPTNFKPSFPLKLDPSAERPLGAMPVTHVGIAVDDLDEAANAFGQFFNATPVVTELNGAPVSGSDATTLHVARWQQGNVAIELVQSTAKATPWSDFVEKNGWRGHSIGFDVGDQLDHFKLDLLAKGGVLIFKSEDGKRLFFDFQDALGLVIEISGTPAAS